MEPYSGTSGAGVPKNVASRLRSYLGKESESVHDPHIAWKLNLRWSRWYPALAWSQCFSRPYAQKAAAYQKKVIFSEQSGANLARIGI